MLSWFLQQDSTMKAAIIGSGVTIIVALIGGIFKLMEFCVSHQKKKSEAQNSVVNISQTTTGNNNTFIGVQNNRKE